jgi:hypothetical protein
MYRSGSHGWRKMNAHKWTFFLVGVIFFGFVAWRPNTVVWLLSYGKPKLVPNGVTKAFQIMAYVGLIMLGANVIFDLQK